MIRIVLVDDHNIMRAGLRAILQDKADIEIVGEAEDGEKGLALIRQSAPEIALVDVHMPGISGVELTERVRRAKLSTKVVILTAASQAPFPRRLLEAGASGYLTKACPADELIKAIRQIADGKRYISSEIAQQLALATMDGEQSPFEKLSARELEIAIMLASGLKANEIAKRLHLSEKTVATYKARLLEKLGIDNVVALANLAAVHGLLKKS